ncbi:MAG: ThuA domain-containing protein [Candidatus Binatus sp.]|uniref:ThuA domain-containing protein n=1 Tax=Candidatus Binatus sp. TaxID=2811406 RepID=UPI00271DA0AC|nr:ThuA domain-containing protein [Candidatus Binatus sp.]MDO8433818.1 ThuA domain-containing protein [Candidatus Binatus sp.]
MSRTKSLRVHLITGGFPPGSAAGHDMDYARLRLLGLLQEKSGAYTTTSNDFADIERWLPGTQLLVTYVAGPYPSDEQNRLIQHWLEEGGRWLALHGTSGGRAAPVGENRAVRKVVKGSYHATLGSFFLNHPPVRKFRVDVAKGDHILTRGLPPSFEVTDELYLIELQHPESTKLLLTTELEKDPSPKNFGFVYDQDTSLLADGKTRAIGYTREIGRGGVTYYALGHCHSPANNVQPFVDASVEPSGKTPLLFRGAWETPEFERLLRNGIEWGAAT